MPNPQPTVLQSISIVPDRFSLVALVLANLTPMIGVLFWGWDIAVVVLIYWMENLVVGFYNLLKMAFAPVHHPGQHLGKLFLMGFFSIHYGGFCAIHGIFLVQFLKVGNDFNMNVTGSFGPLVFLDLLFGVIAHLWVVLGDQLWIPLAALMISHGVSLVENYFLKGERLTLQTKDLMGQPYGRIVLVHLAILTSAFFIFSFGSPLPLLILLVLGKLILDAVMHHRSHRKTRRKAVQSAS